MVTVIPTCLQQKHLSVRLVDIATTDGVVRLSRWDTFVNLRFVVPPAVKNCAFFVILVYLTMLKIDKSRRGFGKDGETRYVYIILLGKPLGKSTLR